MTTDQPDSSSNKTPGRGVDLFFGDSEAAEGVAGAAAAGGAALHDAASQTAESVQAAGAAGAAEVSAGAAAAAEAAPTAIDDAAAAPAAIAPAPERAAPPATTPSAAAPPSAPPPPPANPPVVVEGTPAKGSNGCLPAVLGATFGALLGVLLTLGLLFVANQGLSYAPRDTVVALQATVTAYERSAGQLNNSVGLLHDGLVGVQQQVTAQGDSQGALAGEVSGVISQVQDLQTRAEVLPVLQEDVAGLQTSVQDVSGAVDLVAGDVATLTQRVDVVSVSAERAQRFLDGMQALLASVMADEPLPATQPVTTTRGLTATAPLTSTAPITSNLPLTTTPPITATMPFTAEVQAPLTSTLTVTATVAPTATVTPPASPALDAIRGMVFLDANRDGVRAAAEPGIANVQVTLYTQDRKEVARTTTNLQGEYEFSGLTPGIYIVVQTDPPGFVSSSSNVLTAILRSNRPVENVNFGDYR